MEHPDMVRIRLSATPSTLDRLLDRIAPLFRSLEVSEPYPNVRYPDTSRIYLTGQLTPQRAGQPTN